MKTGLLRVVGIVIVLVGLVPAGVLLYKCLHWLQQDQREETYLTMHLIEAAMSAFGGFVIAYLLFRMSGRKP